MPVSPPVWPSADCNDIRLADPVAVTVEGTVVVFARQAEKPVDTLYYNVRVSGADSGGAQEWAGWNELPLAGRQPGQDTGRTADDEPQMRLAGMGLITVDSAATVPQPADAPFRVVTDGTYVSCIRQSTSGSLYVDRFVLVQIPRRSAHDSQEAQAPDAWRLERTWEVRYRRSERRDSPAGPGDTLGSRNMVDEPFLEPTLELPVLTGVTGGRFDVLLVPTTDPDVRRWHIIAVVRDRLTFLSCPQGRNGGLDLDPTRTHTFTVAPALVTADGPVGLRPTAGVGAALYGEQEPAVDTEGEPTSLRRAMRMAVALPVDDASARLAGAMAVYDFTVFPDGTVPAPEGDVGCLLIDGTLTPGGFVPTPGVAGHPVPAAAVHPAGDGTVSAVLLGTPRPGAAPELMDGSDGLLHCYFPQAGGVPGQEPFSVAQFDPTVGRAKVDLPWATDQGRQGHWQLLAQRAGSSFDGVRVTVADCVRGDSDLVTAPELCDVVIDYGPDCGLPGERWGGVPRDLLGLIAVLNGQYSESPSDPDVLSGRRPFYAAAGQLPMARLPMRSDAAVPPRLDLVSHRPDVPLARVEIAAGDDATQLVVHFALPEGHPVVQTWSGLPADTAALAAVLRGDAATGTYPYRPAEHDTPVYALSTDSGTVLLFAAAPGGLEVSVTAAEGGDPSLCDVRVTAGGPPVTLRNVPRDQSAFVDALRNGPAGPLLCHVSPDPVPGQVPDQSTAGALDLRGGSLLFTVVPPVPNGRLKSADVVAAAWQGRTPPPVATDGQAGRGMRALMAVRPGLPLFGQDPWVVNTADARATGGANGTWLAAHQPKALSLRGDGAITVPNAGTRPAPERTWTIESWVLPVGSNPSTVVVYSHDAGQQPPPGELAPSYFLGTLGQSCLRFSEYTPRSPGAGKSYVGMSANGLFTPGGEGFTWEAWIRPFAEACPGNSPFGSVVQVYGEENAPPVMQLGLDADRRPAFGRRPTAKSWALTYLKAADPLPADAWSHVAVTGTPSGSAWTLRIYVDAVPVGTETGADIHIPSGRTLPSAAIGAAIGGYVSLFGGLTEVRLWNFARSAAELRQTRDTALEGDEPGLTGYWPLAEGTAHDGALFPNRARATQDAHLDGKLHHDTQNVVVETDSPLLSMVTSVGGSDAVLARSSMRAGQWNHLAVAYEAAGAVTLNRQGLSTVPLAYGSCAPSDAHAFAFEGGFCVEAWVSDVRGTDAQQTILAQWGERSADQSFRFGLTDDGRPFCTVRVDVSGGLVHELTATNAESLFGGRTAHVAAVLECVPIPGRAAVECTLTVWVDALTQKQVQKVFSGRMPVTSVASSAPVTMGVAVPPSSSRDVALESQAAFSGTLTGIRFWSVGLNTTEVLNAMNRRQAADHDDGVRAAWWFTDGNGTVATDPVGGNDLVLTDTDLWGAFKAIGSYACYCNGRPVGEVVPAGPEQVKAFGATDQLTIGAGFVRGLGGPAPQPLKVPLIAALNGSLAEVRLWRAALSRSQIADSMYRGLAGNESGLVAYWPLDGNAGDRTGQGLDGEPLGTIAFVASQAPVADEGPQVHNVYHGPTTRLQRPLTGRPAVVEYPETETRWDGSPYAAMRRAYAFADPAVVLSTGYGLGELGLVFLGQVQTDPTLIGYIEGAPPVPSENLSRPLYDSPLGYNSYQDASTVTLRTEEATSISFTSSDYRTVVKMDLLAKGGLPFADSGSVLLGVFGQQTYQLSAAVGPQLKTALETARQHDESRASEWLRTSTDTLGLRGTWEPEQPDPADYVDPLVGRRYQPLNVGYALVESLTADLYALRLNSTGVMVGKVVHPSPEIPRDRNVITFRIDPRYVKNGTLDGKVGLSNDPAYPQADLARGSYFAPAEAYRLEDDINRSDEALRTYYEQFDAQRLGLEGPGAPDLDDTARKQFWDFGRDLPVRGIANRYVWTATGGLHAETEQFSSAYERTYSGFYDLTVSGGLTAEGKFATPVGGVFASLDLLFGGHIKVQVGKRESRRRSLSLAVTAAGETLLQSYHAATGYSPYPCPGKVDAYRFMSFYLPPSDRNGEEFLNRVVDREWLTFSSDPNAVALRGVQFTGHGAWRVLHRVTYVSRVPPHFDTNPDQNVAPEPVQPVAVADNPLLIALVERALNGEGVPAGSHTPAEIGAAVAAVLAPPDGKDSLLGAIVPWWAGFLAASRRPSPDERVVALLNRILRDTVAYFQAGYASGVLPLPS